MEYKMKIAGLERSLPLCKVADDLYIAAFILFGDVEITKAAATELLKRAPEYDIMLTAECKSIPLIYEMARQSGDCNYIIARKGTKVYMHDVISAEVNSITTAHPQVLYLDGDAVNAIKGKRVLIVDDVISTGESLKCLELLAEKAGANIVGKMAILAEGDAADREDIICLEKLPLFNPDGSIKE
jgi:adenine phosphoribosyltransferase